MAGRAVHAKKGQRDRYQPLQTPLCEGSSPHAVIDGLLGLHGFATLYVADLDALTGRGCQRALLARLRQDYPALEFWVDCGLPADGPPAAGNAVPVVGSESLDGESARRILPGLGGAFILSLDYIGERLLGAGELFEEPALWPDRVILMSLSRVGANEGPDFPRLEQFRARWPEKRLIAAGGVRGADDLRRLEALGVSGVLLASALHSGAVGQSVLREYG
jgi:phosphoribosylformimino-5-aminoimidazole carboxamide ribotide isomerase